MTVLQLKELLEDVPVNAEVQIQIQPNYPLRVKVKGVCTNDDISVYKDEGDQPVTHLFIVAGDDYGYGDSYAWDAARKEA